MAHDHSHASGSRGRLAVVFTIVAVIFVVQVIGSIWTGSLALLVDTGHNAVDLIGIGVALFAATLVRRPPRGQRTWGFRRAEVLAAGAQATLLLGLGVYSLIEGIRRFFSPPEVPGPELLLFGAVGLIGNVVSIGLLASSKEDSLNLRAAFLEVIADALGSLAVVLAALAIWLVDWSRADAVAALVIAALIVPRAFAILRETGSILLETAPRSLDLESVKAHIEGVEHVQEVHDLHVTRIDSNLPVLTAHVVLADECFYDGHAPRILGSLQACLAEHFEIAIEHSTFQFDRAKDAARETRSHR
ncbi:cobalt-zinc-cadmium efflux system protein [Brevibacterium sanguinis]|uniref:Cobalt-zinc-cadmium efflux system protein n=2 Tax=Brevibacterium TaxID=1696 RepID=A0A366ILJ3_9MICO|nr:MULTISPECIES: cation diffusion facilitator family transporter [Brevibacterium]RBP67062.1 cobalt-zinc-cadmium efflux system protein [Brevibacterium sanguinis]RBP73587.1 cobalt-zinc-cadmium efflux system protein [Brevibacterium celere]